MLCEMIESENLPVVNSLEYLEFTGEYLEEDVRRRAEKLFRCATANQYGTGEVNSIAYECPQRHMHIMGENVYVEIINEKDGIGDICVTSLKNRAMPYIRYNTGDKGKILEGGCACGNCNSVMEVCNGRANDWVRKADHTEMHPFSLLQVINEVNARMNAVIFQYQIIQREYDYFVFRLVVRGQEEREQLEKMICKMTALRIGQSLSVEFEYYRQMIPDVRTGKIATFLCEIK